MTAAIPAAVFADNAEVYLRIWFDDGINSSQLLSPDQRLGAVGYALAAGSVDAAQVTGTLAAGQLPSEVLLDGASGVSLSGTFDGTVTGDGSGLTGLNSTSLTGPLAVDLLRNVGNIDNGGSVYDVEVSGNHAYLATGFSGLRIYDITDPANPASVSLIGGGADAQGVAVAGGLAYLANDYGGLRIFDVG
jgi:hypothetical protein